MNAYIAQARNRPAVVLEANDRFRRFHWLYWQVYKTDVVGARYRTLFGGPGPGARLPPRFALLRLVGMARRERRGWRVTEFGAIWMHRVQQLFWITYIDDIWAQCKAEPRPEAVVLH